MRREAVFEPSVLSNKRWLNVLKWLLIIGILGFFIAFLSEVDWVFVCKQLQILHWKFLIIILISGLAYFTASIAWHFSFVNTRYSPGFLKLFYFRQVGESLGIITPASILAGDSLKLWMLEKTKIPGKEALTSIIFSRIMLILSMLFLVSIFLTYYLIINNLEIGLIPSIGVFLLVGFLFFTFLLNKDLWLFKIFYFINRKWKNKYTSKILRQSYELNSRISEFFYANPIKVGFIFLLSLLHWIIGSLEFYYILTILDLNTTLLQSLNIEIGVTTLKSLGAFIPGQIGVEEYANNVMLNAVGYKIAGLWVVVSIIRRTRQLFWIGLGGIGFLVFKKIYK